MNDLDRRRVRAALAAWYAPGRAPDPELGDIEDMRLALAEPTVEAALLKWAYKRTPAEPLPADDLEAMERARAAAAAVTT